MSHHFTISGHDENPFDHPLISPPEARRQFALSIALVFAFFIVVCAVGIASTI